MTRMWHLNAGWIQASPSTKACCHCLVLQDERSVALIDTGIGLEDVRDPFGRIGKELIERVGFLFDARDTAIEQLRARGIEASNVEHIILTHLDADHVGGLADFPNATVHVSREELEAMEQGSPRYLPSQFTHGPKWHAHDPSKQQWFGLEARKLDLPFDKEVYLIPLFGHTTGHCGVAVEHDGRWVLYVGDAYYLKLELDRPEHSIGQLAASRAVDNSLRLQNLDELRRLRTEHGDQIQMFGYHDVTELPAD